MIHIMKYQALFSLKIQNTKMMSAAAVISALRVKNLNKPKLCAIESEEKIQEKGQNTSQKFKSMQELSK